MPYSPELKKEMKSTSHNMLLPPICRRCSILFSFLSVQILIIYLARISTLPDAAVTHCSRVAAVSNAVPDCPSGKFYVYDLPSAFNDNLVSYNCTDLHPWILNCGMASNHGLGAPATELHRLLPESLSDSWFRTNPYALELIFHHRIMRHGCRTPEPESAAAFYIPYYGGLAALSHFFDKDAAVRDRHDDGAMRWVRRQSHWKRSCGSDHFTALGRIARELRREMDSWGGSKLLTMPELQKATKLIVEKFPGEHREVAVPYPTGFHPETREALENWQGFARGYNRSALFAFVGATRDDDFGGLLLSYCSDASAALCRLVDCAAANCAVDHSVVLESFLGSEFCLQPPGDIPTGRSAFDCMVAGSVPVFFRNETAYDQYVWFLPESYSVYIDEKEVRNRSSVIEEVLRRYSKEEIRRKREKVIETIPRIIYGGGSPDFEDAFEIAINGVLERIKKERVRLW